MRHLVRPLLRGAAAVALLAAAAAPAAAQASADEQAVREVVSTLFEAMAARDTATMASLFAEDARFAGVARDGTLRYTTPAEFIASVGGSSGPALNETLYDIEVRVDGPLAVVWTYYTFHLGDEFSHCGYDAFQMLKLQDEWKIVHLADSRRREGCTHQER